MCVYMYVCVCVNPNSNPYPVTLNPEPNMVNPSLTPQKCPVRLNDSASSFL